MTIVLEKTTGFDEDGNEKTEKKTYIAPHVKARMVRKALEMSDKIDTKNMKPESLDEMVGYVVEVYGKQFTIDDFYDGIDSDKMLSTIMDCIRGIVGTMGAKLEQFPNKKAGNH